MGFFASDHF
jgi:TLC domain